MDEFMIALEEESYQFDDGEVVEGKMNLHVCHNKKNIFWYFLDRVICIERAGTNENEAINDETVSGTDSIEIKVEMIEPSEKKNKQYSNIDLKKAIESVRGGSSVRAAAKQFGVPVSTLFVKNKGKPQSKQGKQPIMSADVEAKIADWIVYCAKKGDPKTKQEVIAVASEYLKRETGRQDSLSDGWFKKFMRRHPTITSRTPQLVTQSSARVTEEDIRRFHKTFSDWLEEEGFSHLANDPTRWLNADETGFDLNPKPKRMLAEKGQKDVYHVEPSDTKKRISVMYTFGADGSSYKPQLIVPSSSSKIPDMLIKTLSIKLFKTMTMVNFIIS